MIGGRYTPPGRSWVRFLTAALKCRYFGEHLGEGSRGTGRSGGVSESWLSASRAHHGYLGNEAQDESHLARYLFRSVVLFFKKSNALLLGFFNFLFSFYLRKIHLACTSSLWEPEAAGLGWSKPQNSGNLETLALRGSDAAPSTAS